MNAFHSNRSGIVYRVLLLSVLVLATPACTESQDDAVDAVDAVDAECHAVTEIEGTYDCTGECVVTAEDGTKSVVQVTGEVDEVERFPGATANLFRIEITGADNFHEVEIGALAERTLRTATAEVSDGQYPVLEEYVFETDASCNAVSYTKIVRNPTPEQFKACDILCEKQ